MNRFLTGCIAIETKNARLNGSSKDVEIGAASDTVKNKTYTKKIVSRGRVFPYASGPYIKKNIKNFAQEQGHKISSVRALDTTQAVSEGNPFINYDEDVMGFMIASKLTLSEEEFKELSPEEQVGFKRTVKNRKTIYEKNITKKRKARLMVSPLQAISSTKINEEFCTRETDSTNIIFTKEVYSAIMSMGFNLDINNVGKFTVSEDESGFRDYSPEELESLGLEVNEDGMIILDQEERERRVVDTLRAMQFFNTDIAQSNNLEDLNAKFVIMAEYSIGNNIFNNIFRNSTLDIDYLHEAIEENEEFRNSKICIGIRSGFIEKMVEKDEKGGKEVKDLKEILKEKYKDNDNIFIGTVKEAFDEYIDYLKK